MSVARLSDQIQRRGLMLVLSSPSGAGKSSIARILLEQDRALSLSVSVTTRPKRASEVDGVHYHFISVTEFERLRDSDALLEWAEVHGNYYGTPRDAAEKALSHGRDMLFDIDVQGALQLREKVPSDVVLIFILPPSFAELRNRLHRRAEDSEEVIARRLQNSATEMAFWRDYDYVVINEDLEQAYGEVKSVVQAERLRRDRRPGLFDFVETLSNPDL